MKKEALYGKTLDELKSITSGLGFPGYTAKQIAEWLYKKDASDIDMMSNLSKKARAVLNEKYEVGLTPHHSFQESTEYGVCLNTRSLRMSFTWAWESPSITSTKY